MFCEKCGKEIPDSTKFCPYCGAAVSKAQDFVNKAGEVFNAAEQELGSAFDEVKQSLHRKQCKPAECRWTVQWRLPEQRSRTVQRRLPE